MSATPILIDKPGIYDVPELDYHRDAALAPGFGPSLSNSGMKTLLDCPARYQYERTHGRPPKDAFDLGGLVHELVLHGGDARIRVIDAYDWRSKAAQEAKKKAHADRLIPVHRGDLLLAARIARAVKAHPLAGPLFAEGEPEKSVYWVDQDTGHTCRARIDWVRTDALVDFKTCRYGHASPEKFARDCAVYEYAMQQVHYLDGWEAVTGERPPFIYVVAETAPPYLVSVFQISDLDLEAARQKVIRARHAFAEHHASGIWPDYGDSITTLNLPDWYIAAAYEDMEV